MVFINAEIIAVGTELLLGQILNTNAKYLAEELSKVGINLYYQTVVGDNYIRIKNALDVAYSRSELVILTGGLGPTNDDITKETVSDYFELSLVLDKNSLNEIEKLFKQLGRSMTSTNMKQAMMPNGCKILKNYCGTAPGCIIEKGTKTAIILPGPPREMKVMFESGVLPYLQGFSKDIIVSKTIKIFGIGEAQVEHEIRDLMDNDDPTVAPYAKEGEVELRVTCKSDDETKANAKVLQMVVEIEKRIGEYIYGYDNQTLAERAVSILREQGLKISVAESCTGGMVGGAITSIPGSSEVFETGYITYSNNAKQKLLGVAYGTLERYGAVSPETACEMAKGAKKHSGADIAISVTGIAGPDGGSEAKPVGLIYIGCAYKNKCESFKVRTFGDRDKIRRISTLNALSIIINKLK